MRIVVKFIGLGIIVLLSACSSFNPFSAKSSPKFLPTPLLDFTQSMAVRTVWTYVVGNSGAYEFSPALAKNNVFAAATDGSVARIEVDTGRLVWRVNAGMSLTGGVGSDGNTVAIVGNKGAVIALDGEGGVRWKVQSPSEILSAPAVGQGLVIVRSVDNQILALDAETGARRWSVRRSAPLLSLRAAPGIVISGSLVIVAMPGGRLLALDTASGASRWEAVVGDPKGATELERIADISGLPYVSGADVCAVAFQGRIGCFDMTTGTARWTKNFSSNVGVAVDERFVFGVDETSNVLAFTRHEGQSVWRNKQLANRRLSMPVSFGRTVATGDMQGYVHFLSREDGGIIGRIGTDGSPIISTPLVAGPYLIFQTQSGAVVALVTE